MRDLYIAWRVDGGNTVAHVKVLQLRLLISLRSHLYTVNSLVSDYPTFRKRSLGSAPGRLREKCRKYAQTKLINNVIT